MNHGSYFTPSRHGGACVPTLGEMHANVFKRAALVKVLAKKSLNKDFSNQLWISGSLDL